MIKKIIKKTFSVLKIFSIILVFAITVIIAFLYGSTPVYIYEERKPFSGDSIYNPYQNCDEKQWIKANFHAHSSAWMGLTNGAGQTSKDVYDIYKKLHYDFIGISNYQKIDDYNKHEPQYLPIYEHGYGIAKCHQLCIGAEKVNNLEYPFWQSTNDKQHVINTLKESSELVCLNHPRFRNGYNANQLKKITNYDCFEVLNGYVFSLKLWDTVLSSGYPAFLIANDDSHDAFDPFDIGRVCTFLNVDTLNEENIKKSLKYGKSYGFDVVYLNDSLSFDIAAKDALNYTKLKYCKVKNDTIFVKFTNKANDMAFIGQNGNILKLVKFTDSSFYKFEKNDTYVRIEMYSNYRGHKIFLNPIFRYNNNPLYHYKATIDSKASLIKKIIYYSLFVIFWTIIFIIYKRKKSIKTCSNRYHIRQRHYY